MRIKMVETKIMIIEFKCPFCYSQVNENQDCDNCGAKAIENSYCPNCEETYYYTKEEEE